MNPSRSPQKSDVLKLGPPAAGEVTITVDSSLSGASFAAGTETLLPKAEIPVHRHLGRDEVLFVHKGQGRATLNEQVLVVVPGAILYVPRGAWHGLRNTGTGVLQIAWVSAPPGLEAFFRDLSRLGPAPSAAAIQELAQRHQIEFRPATAAPMPETRQRHGRRAGRHRHRGRRGTAPIDSSGQNVRPPSARVEPSSAAQASPGSRPAPPTPPAAPAAPAAQGRHRPRRRRHGGDGRGVSPPATGQTRRAQADGTTSVSAPSPAQGTSRPSTGGQRPPRGRRRRVKEVYMGGRWVQVEGDEPVIAPGPERPDRRGPKRGGDDEPPAAPLSVSL